MTESKPKTPGKGGRYYRVKGKLIPAAEYESRERKKAKPAKPKE